MLQIEWTQGVIMFYGGILGIGLVLIVGIITVLALGRSKARINKKLDWEYGKRER